MLGFEDDLMNLAAAFEDLNALVLLLLKQSLVSLEVDVAIRIHPSDTRLKLIVLHVICILIIVAKVVVH